MFNLIKFATHFGPFPFGSIDPMLIALIRQERRMKAAENEQAAENTEVTSEDHEAEEVRKAA